MKTLAKDSVWIKTSWGGTAAKASFTSSMANIHQMLIEVSKETFKDDVSVEFIDGKIKSNLRHAMERLNRASNKK